MTVFDQPHIFIVYPPGAGGNFISNVCRSIQNCQLNNIDFPQSGSSHVDLDRKMLGTDFLSFGTLPNSTYAEHHSDQRINYYLDNIQSSYENKPHVTWTHDYSNIPVYQKYFPNSKIIAVTQTTDDEKLTVLFMRLLKTHMSDDANKPFSKDEALRFMFIWQLMVKRCLIGLGLGSDTANKIILDIRNPEYYDIVNYASIWAYLHYYGIASIVDSKSTAVDVTDKMFYPAESSIKFVDQNYKRSVAELEFKNKDSWNQFPREVKNNISDYLSNDVIVMPYSTIAHADTDSFKKIINRAFNSSLNTATLEYVENIFQKYIKSQNQLILTQPWQYYLDCLDRYQRSISRLLQDNNT